MSEAAVTQVSQAAWLRKTPGVGGRACKLYTAWMNMRNRCRNPNYHAAKHYSKKGVFVCAEWHDYAAFRTWAVTNGFRKDLTLERNDNAGPYGPGNCRWATWEEQHRNQGCGQKITPEIVREIRSSAALQRETAERYGIAPTTVSDIVCGRTWAHVS